MYLEEMHEKLTHTFTNNIEEKRNQNNKNKNLIEGPI